MKYYKNLIKNKNYVGIVVSIIFTLLGVFVIYISFSGFFKNGLENNDINTFTAIRYPLTSFLGSSNFGMIIVGFIVFYTGFFAMPRWSSGSQNDEDYTIQFIDEDKVYIKYKKYEFLVNKNFEPTSLFFRDKNKKFVTITLGYQIYNYYLNYRKKLRLEKRQNKGNHN